MPGWGSRPHCPEADRSKLPDCLEGAETRRSRPVRSVGDDPPRFPIPSCGRASRPFPVLRSDAVASNGNRLSNELRLTADRSATTRFAGGAPCIRQSTFVAIAGLTRSGCEVSAASTFWSGRTTVERPRFWNASSCFVRRAIRMFCLPSSRGAVSGVTRGMGIPSHSLTSTACFRGMTCGEKSWSKGVVTVPAICPIGTGRSRSRQPVFRDAGGFPDPADPGELPGFVRAGRTMRRRSRAKRCSIQGRPQGESRNSYLARMAGRARQTIAPSRAPSGTGPRKTGVATVRPLVQTSLRCVTKRAEPSSSSSRDGITHIGVTKDSVSNPR